MVFRHGPVGVAAAVVAGLLLLAGCAGGDPKPAQARVPLVSCVMAGSIPAKCGHLTVAENPAAPGGRQITLKIAVLPAQAAQHAPDPLLYLAGWLGAATDLASQAMSLVGRLNLTRDVVLVDQRGTGGSNRPTCPAPRAGGSVKAEVDRCLASLAGRADPRFYTTPLAVDDFDRVRAALGYDKVNLYGASYGVSSGLAYLQRHSEHVRAAVFDSGSLLDVRLWEQSARHAQQSLDALFSQCRADSACRAAYPDFQAEFTSVTARLATRQVTVSVTDPTSFATRSITINRDTFLSAVIDDYLSTPDGRAQLPRAIHLAAGGKWSALATAYAQGDPQGSDATGPPMQEMAVRCSDAWAGFDPARVRADAGRSLFTESQASQATVYSEACRWWPKARGISGAVHTDVPVVFLNGTVDPVDPPENVAAARATMPNSLSVAVPNVGHGTLGWGCVASEAMTFLQSGKPPDPSRWSCVNDVPLPAFAVG